MPVYLISQYTMNGGTKIICSKSLKDKSFNILRHIVALRFTKLTQNIRLLFQC